MADHITVVIPTIPPRAALLGRALTSVSAQTYPAAAVSIAVDLERRGAPLTKQRAMQAVRTPWLAMLDDDDEFEPWHLETLIHHAWETGADYVFSWFKVIGGADPFPPGRWRETYDPANPIHTTTTILVRTELAQEVGYSRANVNQANSGEDWHFQMTCQELGVISHSIEREHTWLWHHDSRNTSGLAGRW